MRSFKSSHSQSTHVLSIQLRQRRRVFALLEMRRDDVSERMPLEQLIRQRHQSHDLSVQLLGAVREHVETELESFAVVTLVVGELYEHDDLHERIARCVTLRFAARVRDALKNLL